jgi:hypothetical protein
VIVRAVAGNEVSVLRIALDAMRVLTPIVLRRDSL